MTKKIFSVAVVLFCGLFLAGCGKSVTPSTTTPTSIPPTPVPPKPIEETIKERPFVSLTPTSDGHRVMLKIENVPAGVDSVEYEVVYLADVEGSKIERGVRGAIKLSDFGKSKEILFGSASCTTGTCKYKYDENVTEGTLSVTLIKKDGKSKYDSVFRIQRGKEGKEGLTTGDGIFKFLSVSLPANTLYLTVSSIGIPSALPSGLTAKSLPYGIFSAPAIKGTVSFKSTENEARIYLWSGQKWQELVTASDEGILSAETAKVGIFILAK